MLSNILQSIHLFRYDAVLKQIFIIAGDADGIEVMIFEDGSWEFNNDSEI